MKPQPPKELDAIVDKVLAYRPKPKSEAGKKRKRKAVTRIPDRAQFEVAITSACA